MTDEAALGGVVELLECGAVGIQIERDAVAAVGTGKSGGESVVIRDATIHGRVEMSQEGVVSDIHSTSLTKTSSILNGAVTRILKPRNSSLALR